MKAFLIIYKAYNTRIEGAGYTKSDHSELIFYELVSDRLHHAYIEAGEKAAEYRIEDEKARIVFMVLKDLYDLCHIHNEPLQAVETHCPRFLIFPESDVGSYKTFRESYEQKFSELKLVKIQLEKRARIKEALAKESKERRQMIFEELKLEFEPETPETSNG